MNILNTTLTAKRLLLGGVAVLGVAALAGCGGGGSSLAPAAPAESTKTDGTETETGTPVVSFKVASTDSVAADAGTQNITVDLSEPALEGGLTLSYTVGDGTTSTAGTVRVAAGDRTVTIPVPVPAGSGGKTFTVTLVKGANYIPEDGNATFRLMVGDKMPVVVTKPMVSFSTASVSQAEGATVTITVASNQDAPEGGLAVSYMIGTAGEITANGLAGTSGTVTIPKGQKTATIEVMIDSGDGAEPEEMVVFILEDDDAYRVDSAKNTFTLTIPLNEGYTPPAIPQVTVSSSMTRGEDAGTYDITVTLDRDAPSGGLVVSYTVGGTATAGASNDYTIAGLTGTTGTVTVPTGQRTATITVTINDDSTASEGSETVMITVNRDAAYGITTGTHTLTITDNDPRGDGPVVGDPVKRTDGSLTAQAIQTAVNRNTSELTSVPAGQTGRWGFWLESDNSLSLWAEPPNDTYGSVTVGDSALTGTATYTGGVAGLAYYGQQGTLKGGEFEADIILTADFRDTEETTGTLIGTVSGFEGVGANDAWPSSVTLEDGGNITGTGVSGSWSSELYREGSSGNPDGVTGFVDIDFSVNSQPDGRARGAFHAVGE